MKTLYRTNEHTKLLKELKIDCKSCAGICCTALYYAKSEGFPCDKKAGDACSYLSEDFKCLIHRELMEKKLHGCMAYDCFGAGQKVIQKIYKGADWKRHPELKKQMFEVFLAVERLHQMLSYLVQASMLIPAEGMRSKLDQLIEENNEMTLLPPEKILELDIDAYRKRVNECLKEASDQLHLYIHQKPSEVRMGNYMGKNFKKADLRGRDFTVSLLIAANLEGCKLQGANFLGADMRDTNICSTDLSQSLFLTQGQINAAKGNSKTLLPPWLERPAAWDKN